MYIYFTCRQKYHNYFLNLNKVSVSQRLNKKYSLLTFPNGKPEEFLAASKYCLKVRENTFFIEHVELINRQSFVLFV